MLSNWLGSTPGQLPGCESAIASPRVEHGAILGKNQCRGVPLVFRRQVAESVQAGTCLPSLAPMGLEQLDGAATKGTSGPSRQQAAVGRQRHAARPGGITMPAMQGAEADPVLCAPGLQMGFAGSGCRVAGMHRQFPGK